MTTDLKTLSAMIAIVNEWDIGHAQTSQLLTNLFEVIKQAIPQAQTLRLFRVLKTHIIEIGTTDQDDKTPPVPIQRYANSVYSTGLRSKHPISPDEGVSWYYAPSRDGRQSVLLILRLSSRPSDLDNIETLIRVTGDLINTAIQQRASRLFLKRQALVTSRLSQAESFQDIVHAISYNVVERGQFITLNLISRDENGQISGIEMVGSGNHHESFEAQVYFPLPENNAHSESIAEALSQGKHIFFNDVQNAPDLDPLWKTTFDDKPIISLALFPMRVQGQIIGTVNYLDIRAPIDLSDDETELMQSIADQAGSVISLRDLSEATVSAREAVTNLVSASRRIATASNYLEITQAIRETMAQDATSVIITLHNQSLKAGEYPTEDLLVGFSMKGLELNLSEPMSVIPSPPELIDRLYQRNHIILTGEEARASITPEMLEAFNLPPQEWIASFPLRAGDYLLGGIYVIYETEKILTDDELVAYTTLADQIAMVVRSQQLLEESTRLQQLASQLVQAEHAIALTDNYTEMLQVILDLLPQQIHGVFLVLFDRTFVTSDAPISMTVDSYVTRESGGNVNIIDIIDTQVAGWAEGMEYLKTGAFMASEDLEINRISSPNSVQFYMENGVQSILTTGLRVGRNIIGLLVLAKEPNYLLRPDQEANLRAIIDQLATTVENRQLLQQTSATLTETTILFNVNRDLINTQNDVDILQVIYEQAVPHSLGIISAQVIYNVDSPQDLQLETLYNGELVDIDRSLAHEIGIGGVVTYLKTQGYPELVFLSHLQTDANSTAIFKLAGLNHAKSAVFMPIYDEDQLLHVLIIGFEQTRAFEQSERRLFSSIRGQIQIVLQNQRLLVEMQKAAVRLGRQVQSLQTINHMSGVITAATDQKTLFDNTCTSLYNVLGVNHISISLYDKNNHSIEVVSEYPDHASIGNVYNIDDPVQSRLLTDKAPVIVDDITRSSIDGKLFSVLKKIGIKTIALLPLLTSDEEFIGVIGLHFSTEGRIPPETIDIARTLTSQIIIAMQNIQLLDTSRRQAERMERIATFSRSVQASLEVEELLKTGIQGVRDIIPSDYASVILYDSVAGRPRRVAWQEFPSRIVVSLQGGSFVDLPATTAGTVWKTQETLSIPDHQSLGALQFSGSRHVRSSLSVPIFSRGALRGVMELGNNRQSAYTITDRFILQQLVNQLAIAVENAEAYQQSQRVAQSKALVNDISIKLQQQTSIDQIMDVTMKELGQALGAKRGRIRLTPDALQKTDEGSSS